MSGERNILELTSGLSYNHKWISEIYTKLWLNDEPIQEDKVRESASPAYPSYNLPSPYLSSIK